jgi:nucleoside-diphosphate-sugar epimerase
VKVLLTGGTGFVGPAAARALTAAGHEVRCLVRRSSDLGPLSGAGPLEFAIGDVAEATTLPPALEGCAAVVHLAGLTKTVTPDAYYRVNADGTGNLAGAAAAAGVKRFVHCSTLAVAGPMAPGRPVREEDPPAPVSHYGRSKLAAEEAVRHQAGAMETVIVRPPIVYGPRDHDFFEVFKMAARGLALKPGLAGEKRYSMIYVEDLGRALALALERGRPAGAEHDGSGVYYVSDGGVYAWGEVIRAAGRALGRANTVVVPVPESLSWGAGLWGELVGRVTGRAQILSFDKIREIAGAGWACETERARTDLGYAPEWPLERGLEAAAAWYREQRWL